MWYTKNKMSLTGVKFRAYPTAQQKQILSQWMGCARFIYNAKCSEDRYFRTFLRKSLSLTGERIPVDQCYSQFKSEETAWLKECPSQILRNSAVVWYQAYQRFFQGLSGRPVPKRKGKRDSVWLTRELFDFKPEGDSVRLCLGTKTKPLGILSFKAHRHFQIPNSLTISRECGHYYVSFNYEDHHANCPPWEQVTALIAQGEAALLEVTEALDRGVKIPAQSASGESFHFTAAQLATLARKEKNLKHYQKRMNRQQKGSKRRAKEKQKIAKSYQKLTRVRNDFAHQSSHKLVHSQAIVFTIEDLKIRQMTMAPLPKQDASGKYQRNGARAKAGLNAAILSSCWGKLVLYLGYKAKRLSKLVIKVNPYQSSQECAKCHHTHPQNRQSQSVFLCQGCGHAANADQNAAEVLKQRGVKALLSCAQTDWEEQSTGIWKLKNTRGTRESAHGGKSKTPRAKLLVHSQRSANQPVAAR